MGFGQVKQFLNAGSKTDPCPFAPSKSNERLRQLKVAVQRIIPGIEKTQDPSKPIRGRDHQKNTRHNEGAHQKAEMPELGPREQQHA